MRHCDLLITHAAVVTVDAADTVVPDGAIAVSEDRIAAVGPAEVLSRTWQADRVIDAGGGIVLPGLVNTHTHLAMTLFRGSADDLDLQGFLARVWELEAERISPESIGIGAAAGAAESLRCGVTTALDMYFHPEVALEVATGLGLRLITGPALFDLPGCHLDLDAAARWLAARPGQRACLCPHSTYTLDPGQLRAVRELADQYGALVHVHAAENRAEVEEVRARYGRSPIEVLDEAGLLRPETVLAHGVILTASEQRRIAESGAAVAHCPASNLKLGSGFAPVPDLIAQGARVTLGTDGAASSNDLDLWSAMRLAALIHKGRLGDATVLPAARVVRMATIDGARALGLGAELGSIETGKRADLVVMAADHVAAQPMYDPCAAIVYALGRADVRHVLVDGVLRIEDGRLTAADEALISERIRCHA